jgi:indole-3-glycerol phosphate synthase
METILDRIVAQKRSEVEAARRRAPAEELSEGLALAPPVRDFAAALLRGPGVGVIAEVKKASPSAGVLREDFDPVAIARAYQAGGANALSVLTDEPFFQGKLSYLTAIRQAVDVPLLRKDFIIDVYQVLEARIAGADAVLLIAEILDDKQLPVLIAAIHSARMQALVEVYEPANLTRVLDTDAILVGVNNRDLRTFETDLEHTIRLAPKVPPDRILVSESGIRTADDIVRLRSAGVRAVLIGETFMRSGDVSAKLRELRGARP